MRAPSSSPGGTCTVSASLRISTCWPAQVGHTAWRWRPDPPHCAHGFENTMWPRDGLDDAAAVAVQAAAVGRVQPPGAGARPAPLLTEHGRLPLAAAHRLLEAERQRLVQIRAAFRRPFVPRLLALAQDVGEQIAEGGRRRAADAHREVEPLEPDAGRLGRDGRDAHRVVPPPPVGIAERLVRFGDLAELRRGRAVTRIDVRVIPPGQPLVRALDVALRRGPLHAEEHVIVHGLQIAEFRFQIGISDWD